LAKIDKNIFEPDEKRRNEENNKPEFFKSDTNFFDQSGGKKSRQDKYQSNDLNSDREISNKDIKDALNFGERYGDSGSNEQHQAKVISKYVDNNMLDDISVGSLNSLREDTNSNREYI
jgi:hypothetical protein